MTNRRVWTSLLIALVVAYIGWSGTIVYAKDLRWRSWWPWRPALFSVTQNAAWKVTVCSDFTWFNNGGEVLRVTCDQHVIWSGSKDWAAEAFWDYVESYRRRYVAPDRVLSTLEREK